MKRNGMCPICYVRQLFLRPSPFMRTMNLKPVENNAPAAPIMGWSSWNTFRNNIDEKLILETADAMRTTGLLDAGYRYVNLDDNWHSSLRDADGLLQGDLQRFPSGIGALVAQLNAKGFKAGIYSSNGTLTCEDLPASLYRERTDARQFASFGVEYLKYDFCHNEPIPRYAPLVTAIEVSQGGKMTRYGCRRALLSGNATFMRDAHGFDKCHVAGLDKNSGFMEYDCVEADTDGDYVLTVCIRKKGRYEKALAALVNDEELYMISIPKQKKPNYTGRFQQIVHLRAGINKIKLFNPIARRSDSAYLQYRNMAKELASAAQNREGAFKPIVFSICEWGRNKPWKWGRGVGNMWRTTPDIRPWFFWIKFIYEVTVKRHEYTAPGAWNDPDMLEVGNGHLTENQNRAHFSLWCMMNAPLVLGNDLRVMKDSVKEIVTDKTMIAINQDGLYKAAKRLKKGAIDVLAKPLTDGRCAVCLFNKTKGKRTIKFPIADIFADAYVGGTQKSSYTVTEVWTGKEFTFTDKITTVLDRESVQVFILK